MKKITIAIDGFSSTGKSTLAKQLAAALGYVYVDTGAMYRAVTLFAMQKGYISLTHLDSDSLISAIDQIELHFQYNSSLGFAEMFLNGVCVEQEIRSMAVSNLVSKIAEISAVRSLLVKQQQAMGLNKGIVMDGRDIGTVVFPNAALKIFVTADPAIRAERRFLELKAVNPEITMEEVAENLQHRDLIDSTREHSPLRQAEDAIVLDNSNITRDEQFNLALKWALEKINP